MFTSTFCVYAQMTACHIRYANISKHQISCAPQYTTTQTPPPPPKKKKKKKKQIKKYVNYILIRNYDSLFYTAQGSLHSCGSAATVPSMPSWHGLGLEWSGQLIDGNDGNWNVISRVSNTQLRKINKLADKKKCKKQACLFHIVKLPNMRFQFLCSVHTLANCTTFVTSSLRYSNFF